MKAVFLDRDGTINHDNGYIHTVEGFRFINGSIAGMHRLTDAGYQLFVVTNQAGIARGYYSLDEVDQLHAWLNQKLIFNGTWVEEFLVCPHHPHFTGPCACRKPGNELLEQAIMRHELNRNQCWMIGDRRTDFLASQKSRIGFIGIDGRYSSEFDQSVCIVPSINEAANIILGSEIQRG